MSSSSSYPFLFHGFVCVCHLFLCAKAKIEELGNQLNWETRIFEDRRRVMKFVCEVPTAIDQRLFALAREIQQDME